MSKIHSLLIIALVTLFLAPAAFAQDDSGDEDLFVLQDPTYVNEEYGFGVALPDNYRGFNLSGDEIFMAQFLSDPELPSGQLTIEELPEDIVDSSGFWLWIKQRDPATENNLTYEKTSSVAGTGAIQTRIERIERGGYILILSWIFVHDGYGYTLSVTPGMDMDVDATRDLGTTLSEQFRWMTAEEIGEFNSETDETEIPAGEEF
jgi:hypothetical protein